jgi:hypothetical protein
MKKIVRLTESDLTRIVKRVIKEEEDDDIETWDDFYKKYPIPNHDEMDKMMKRIDVVNKNPKLRSRLEDNSRKNNKINQLNRELRALDKERNRIMGELNDLGYNP